MNPNNYIGNTAAACGQLSGGYSYSDDTAPMPASPVSSGINNLASEQHRTFDLLENLNNRLVAVLDHGGMAKEAKGLEPVACAASPLHGDLIAATDRQQAINARIGELLNSITL